MTGIYFRDKNKPSVNTGTKRTAAEFRAIFNGIFRQNTPIRRETSQPLGFIYDFVYDQDANLIFDEQVISKLQDHNFTAELSTSGQYERNIFLIDIPLHIFNKPIQEIKNEIVRLVPHKVLNVVKFCGNNSGRRYIVFSVESQTIRDAMLKWRPMPLFGNPTFTSKPIPKATPVNSHPPAPAYRNRPITQPLPTTPRVAWQCEPSLLHNNPNEPYDLINYPQLSQGTPFPWENSTNNASRSNPPTSATSAQIPSPPPASGVQFRPPNFNDVNDMNFYVLASTSICKLLNDGMDNPVEYLSNINEIFSIQGLPFIEIPNHQLMSSQIKYARKTTATSLLSSTPIATQPSSDRATLPSSLTSSSTSQAQSPSSPPSPTPASTMHASPTNNQCSTTNPTHIHITAPITSLPASNSSLPSTQSPSLSPSPSTPEKSTLALHTHSPQNQISSPHALLPFCSLTGVYPNYRVSNLNPDSNVITISKISSTSSKSHDLD